MSASESENPVAIAAGFFYARSECAMECETLRAFVADLERNAEAGEIRQAQWPRSGTNVHLSPCRGDRESRADLERPLPADLRWIWGQVAESACAPVRTAHSGNAVGADFSRPPAKFGGKSRCEKVSKFRMLSVLLIVRDPLSEPTGTSKSEQTVFPAFSADRPLHAAKIADDKQVIPVAVLIPAQVQRHDTDDEEKTRCLATADAT
jgi:hypothetical protein